MNPYPRGDGCPMGPKPIATQPAELYPIFPESARATRSSANPLSRNMA